MIVGLHVALDKGSHLHNILDTASQPKRHKLNSSSA